MQPMPPPVPHAPLTNAPIAQFTTLFRKTCELGHVWDVQLLMQVMSIAGIPPPPPAKSKQPNTHVRPSEQLWSMQAPQSAAQLVHVSCAELSQRMFPQNAHEPQSCEQLAQVSVPRQRPSPQLGQSPQSPGQVKQSSPADAVHVRSPHEGQAPQSGAQLLHVSPLAGSQKPFRHVSQMPQSLGQLVQFSVAWQVRSPQVTQRPQSCWHVAQLSLG